MELPPGKPLTVVLLGKTGNGKSATGNTIIGLEAFEDSPSGSSVTQLCKIATRSNERKISVIDTPGIMDTAPVTNMDKMKEAAKKVTGVYNEKQQKVLREICKIFAMSPRGLDAIILTIKYGARFGLEDDEALKILQKFLGEDSKKYTILIFTYGDQAKRDAKKKKTSIDAHLDWYIRTLPPWVRNLMTEICNRRLLFNNNLDPEDDHDAYQKQLSQLIQMVDKIAERETSPFKHKLNLASKAVLDEEVKKAMEESGLSRQAEALRRNEEELKKQLAEKERSDKEKKELEKRLAEEKKKQEELKEKERKLKEELEQRQQEEAQTESGGKATEHVENTSGGCYSASSIFVDINGRQRQMDSLQIGEQVQVLSNNEIRYEPVVTFIHRQPEIMQEFLQITTLKNKVLKITEDHLLFVEKMGEARAIPARDVKIGDAVYVSTCHSVESDQVHSISTVFEKGAYAPVTLSGTILVNDVHTSCYFDVLSHDWSQRAMGIARAVYHVSPGMLQWLSSIGQQDGFPGWCRLVHKTLTLMD